MSLATLQFCSQKYLEYFEEFFSEFKGTPESAERFAQKKSMQVTALDAFEKYPDVEPSLIWRTIHKAHINRKSGIDIEPEVISTVISSENSWKKSSGHAFEEMIKALFDVHSKESAVQLVLQKQITVMLKNGEIHNANRDIGDINDLIHSSVFDLYAIKSENDKNFVFGCIQAKTSIRDRVTRDREPSMEAMRKKFWSIAIVLDGDYLKNAKFQNMVDGGTSDYTDNGWHAMYAMSSPIQTDRIIRVGSDFTILANHALKASRMWSEQRQWLDKDWHHDKETA